MSGNKKLTYSSAEVIGENDYLLTQILVHLPLRDVITFKRVSKQWLSLISNPYFSRCRVTAQRIRASGVIPDPNINPPDRELTFFYFHTKICRSCRRPRSFCQKIPDKCSYILQSCNGWMLLHQSSDMFIYNPTTGVKKPLPLPFPSFDESRSADYSLAFDPLPSLDYKLICIFHGKSSKENSYQTMIYSSESGAWNMCGSSFLAPLDMDFAHGVYFKDSVYWIGNKSKTTLRFDLKEECVKDDMPPLPLPPEPQDLNVAGSSYLNFMRIYLKVTYNGYGYILVPACGYMNLVGFDFEFCMRVFRLNEDCSSSSRSWVLMHSVDLRRTIKTVVDINQLGNYSSIVKEYSMLHLIKDGEHEMILLLQVPGKLIVLRLKNNTRYDLMDLKRT